MVEIHFNSTMVRLGGTTGNSTYEISLKFQFHYGAIGRRLGGGAAI